MRSRGALQLAFPSLAEQHIFQKAIDFAHYLGSSAAPRLAYTIAGGPPAHKIEHAVAMTTLFHILWCDSKSFSQ